MGEIRLVLADDHAVVRAGLRMLLDSEEGLSVVAEAGEVDTAKRMVAAHRPDVLILDLEMPGKGGLDVLRELAGDKLPMRTVLLATAIGEKEMLEAVGLGVGGVVLKEMPASSIVLCVRKVLAGEPWLEMRSASRALGKLMQRERGAREAAGVLTARELEVVRLVSRGLRNREVASHLSISEHTVKIHLSHVYTKLGVNGRLALLRRAEDRGYL